MRYRTNAQGKIVPYKKRKLEVQMVFDDDEYETTLDEDIEQVFESEQSNETLGSTDDPTLRHRITALKTMLEHRLHYPTLDIDWDSMTMRDVRDLEHTCNMMLLESPLQRLATRLSVEKNMRDH